MEDLTVWCGNLPSEISEELLYELFIQVAPVHEVRIPTTAKKGGKCLNYGFVTFKHLASVAYAVNMLNGTKLFDRSIIVRSRNVNQSQPQPMSPNIPNYEALMQMGEKMKVNRHDDNRSHNKYQPNDRNRGGYNYRNEKRNDSNNKYDNYHHQNNYRNNNNNRNKRYDYDDDEYNYSKKRQRY